MRFENFNYAGIVTKLLQPILPLFFSIQFNFLYGGWENEFGIDLAASLGFVTMGGLILLLLVGSVGEVGILGGFGLDALVGSEGLLDFDAFVTSIQDMFQTM